MKTNNRRFNILIRSFKWQELTAALSIFFISSASESFAVRSIRTPSDHKKNEILIKFRTQGSATANQAAARISQRMRASHQALRHTRQPIYKVSLPQDLSVETALTQLRNDPSVESAQPNFHYQISSLSRVPADTYYSQLWGLKNTGQTVTNSMSSPESPRSTNNPGTSGKDMNLEEAWYYHTDCSSVVVAVIDTGVNYNHGDLTTNMWNGGSSYPNHGYDFVDDDNNPLDLNGHGTHVAGTIGSIGNNNSGSTGVCWKANLMAVRVLDAHGSGYTSDFIQGINFAVSHGAKIINMSLGGRGEDTALGTLIQDIAAQGVMVVSAAGNDGTSNDASATPTYPCNFNSANNLCVGAVDQKFAMADFSNYGTNFVKISGPGVNIVSLYPGTVSPVTDNLIITGNPSTGWVIASGGTTAPSTWARQSFSIGGAVQPFLTAPDNWDSASTKYAANFNSQVYRSFDLTSSYLMPITLSFYLFFDVANNDHFRVNYKTGSNNPFTSGINLDDMTNVSSSGYGYLQEYDISSCPTSTTKTCSIGFQLQSASNSVGDYGIGLFDFKINTLNLNHPGYAILAGTSMATPHVAGLAALVWSFNPNYTYQDVIQSLKAGSTLVSANATKVEQGRVANALGSLSYINAPTGVTLENR